MVDNGYTSGTTKTTFSPGGSVSRAEAVTFLRALANGSGGSVSFNDVPRNSWYYNSVAWAVDNGITSGSGNGSFNPDGACTREQFVMMLYKLSQV